MLIWPMPSREQRGCTVFKRKTLQKYKFCVLLDLQALQGGFVQKEIKQVQHLISIVQIR